MEIFIAIAFTFTFIGTALLVYQKGIAPTILKDTFDYL